MAEETECERLWDFSRCAPLPLLCCRPPAERLETRQPLLAEGEGIVDADEAVAG